MLGANLRASLLRLAPVQTRGAPPVRITMNLLRRWVHVAVSGGSKRCKQALQPTSGVSKQPLLARRECLCSPSCMQPAHWLASCAPLLAAGLVCLQQPGRPGRLCRRKLWGTSVGCCKQRCGAGRMCTSHASDGVLQATILHSWRLAAPCITLSSLLSGDFTVTSPALSKNALAVGATQVRLRFCSSWRRCLC